MERDVGQSSARDPVEAAFREEHWQAGGTLRTLAFASSLQSGVSALG